MSSCVSRYGSHANVDITALVVLCAFLRATVSRVVSNSPIMEVYAHGLMVVVHACLPTTGIYAPSQASALLRNDNRQSATPEALELEL
jgi:uncharacterized membrane protein